jgi:hypothetical protein
MYVKSIGGLLSELLLLNRDEAHQAETIRLQRARESALHSLRTCSLAQSEYESHGAKPIREHDQCEPQLQDFDFTDAEEAVNDLEPLVPGHNDSVHIVLIESTLGLFEGGGCDYVVDESDVSDGESKFGY